MQLLGFAKCLLNSCDFQSSPVPKDGCNGKFEILWRAALGFQSSPVPKDGCNAPHRSRRRRPQRVSILTRPEGRVQLTEGQLIAMSGHVSILTRPEGRVQPTSSR